jgi:hypothetical protein
MEGATRDGSLENRFAGCKAGIVVIKRRFRVWPGILCWGVLLGGCDRVASPADIRYRITVGEVTALVGGPAELSAEVLRSDGTPVANVPVTWSIPADAGTADSVVTNTDANGLAINTWRPPTTVGTWTITVSAGASEPVSGALRTLAGNVTRFELPDTIRFSRTGAIQTTCVAYDQYDNPGAVIPALHISVTNGFTANLQCSSSTSWLAVTPPSRARATGEFTIRNVNPTGTPGAVLDHVVLLADMPVSAIAVSGVDSILGLTEGETATLRVTGRDANNNFVVIDTASATFSSSDPSVLLVDPIGNVTAVQSGTATFQVAMGDTTFGISVPVFQAYDLGTLTRLYNPPVYHLYQSVSVLMQPDGRSHLFVQEHSHSGVSPARARVEAHAADGALLWTKTYDGEISVQSSPDGGIYVRHGATLFAYDAAGSERWTKSVAGPPIASHDGGVYLLEWTHMRAIATDGASEWTYPQRAILLVSPTRVYAVTSDVLRGLSLSGTELWSRPLQGLTPSKTDEHSNLLLWDAASKTLAVIDSSGNMRWTATIDSLQHFASRGNRVYIAKQRALEARDLSSGNLLWTRPISGTGAVFPLANTVVIYGVYLSYYTIADGSFLGRTRQRLGAYNLTCTQAGLVFQGGVLYFSGIPVNRYDRCE